MQRSSRAVATAAVVAGLGGLAAVALGSQPDARRAATARPLPPLRIVRTQVEVHTITRIERDLPPLQPHAVRPAYEAAPVHATPAVALAPAQAPAAAPVVRQAPVSAPLPTRSSGGHATHGDDGGASDRGDGGGEGNGQDD